MNDKGQYIVEKRLASGGMAEVYLVLYKGVAGFEKRYAMKKIRPEYAKDQSFIESLIHEANISVMMNHENIVQVHELGSTDGTYYILMEYIPGEDLQKILTYLRSSNQKIPIELGLFIISQICTGLEYAHNKVDDKGHSLKIVHRDISPQNIIISETGSVKITDFGIARATIKSSTTEFGTIKGKYAYMSPEQARGEIVDYRSDIFSIGILCYELLTGSNPFDGLTDLEIIDIVREGTLRLPYLLSLPNRVTNIIRTCLAKDPNERYQSCAEMNQAIRKYFDEENISVANIDLAKYVKDMQQNMNKDVDYSDDMLNQSIIVREKKCVRDSSETEIRQVHQPSSRFSLKYIGYVLLLLLLISGSIFIASDTLMKGEDVKEVIPEITLPKPKPKKEFGRLDVFAKPWGYISISGITNKTTSPFRSNNIKLGTYNVTVYYEPENKTVIGEAIVKKNKRTFCTVDFLAKESNLRCK